MQDLTAIELKDFINGKKAAFDKVYAVFSPFMYGTCLRYSRCADDAQDILQETFIKVFKNRSQYDHKIPMAAWLKTITIRTALNYIRDRYRYQLKENDTYFDEAISEEEPTDLSEVRREKLLHTLQQLPDGYRMVFNLYVIDNLTHKEIADYLSISEGTSKSQYSKAKKMLRDLLQNETITI